MEENYEQYKRDLARSQKRHDGLHSGKVLTVVGICFLLYTFYILPFHAGNVSEIRGDELEAGNRYDPEKVYYIEELQILKTNVETSQILKTDADTDDDDIYCIAKFSDCDQNEWIISFMPGRDKQLMQELRHGLTPTVSGYFLLQEMDYLPFGADSFLSVYGSSRADAEGINMIELNAEYLCKGYENYTLKALLRPGVPLLSFVAGLIGAIQGPILLIRNRNRFRSSH